MRIISALTSAIDQTFGDGCELLLERDYNGVDDDVDVHTAEIVSEEILDAPIPFPGSPVPTAEPEMAGQPT
jgi:hypothetical protein